MHVQLSFCAGGWLQAGGSISQSVSTSKRLKSKQLLLAVFLLCSKDDFLTTLPPRKREWLSLAIRQELRKRRFRCKGANLCSCFLLLLASTPLALRTRQAVTWRRDSACSLPCVPLKVSASVESAFLWLSCCFCSFLLVSLDSSLS